MTTATTTTSEVAVVDPEFSDAERYALAAFLAGYRGLTRDACALDLRQFVGWCEEHHLRLFTVRRADIECFARDLEARGRARATVARRLCTVAGFYRYAEQEELLERGHRTLTVTRKGGKIVTIPLAPRTARAIDLAIGERVEGPIFLGGNRERLDRHAAWRIVRRLARRAGINKPVGPHTLRHAFITAALDAGVPLRDVQEAASHADPRTTMRYDRARVSLDRHATYIVAEFIAAAAR